MKIFKDVPNNGQYNKITLRQHELRWFRLQFKHLLLNLKRKYFQDVIIIIFVKILSNKGLTLNDFK